MHDDDVLLPGAIAKLVAPVLQDPNVRVVFGRQKVIDDAGNVQPEATQRYLADRHLNRAGGAIDNPLAAGLLQQFPNDGYLIETALAREVGYRSYAEIGTWADADFGIRVGQRLAPGEMSLVDAFLASYRRSNDALTYDMHSRKIGHPTSAVQLHHFVTALELPASAEYARRRFLRTIAAATVKGFALRADRASALRVFLSKTYGWRNRLTMRGSYHWASIASPAFDKRRYERAAPIGGSSRRPDPHACN